MEHTKYEALVEEALTIRNRNRRDQTRLMVLFQAAHEDGCLEKFCKDIGYSEKAAQNYLKAYAAFVEMGVVPERSDADADLSPVVSEMWLDVFDATLDGRYGYSKVDRDGIDAASEELGLKGPSKAYDIAKNPNSMKAAILGDNRAANAALEALALLAERDEITAGAVREIVRRPSFPKPRHEDLSDVEVIQAMVSDIAWDIRRLRERDIPDSMTGMVREQAMQMIGDLSEVVMILDAREQINNMTV